MQMKMILLSLFVAMTTQSCKIEMSPFVHLPRFPENLEENDPYDFSLSRVIAKEGFKDELLIADNSDTGHGSLMLRTIVKGGSVPKEHIRFDRDFSKGTSLRDLSRGVNSSDSTAQVAFWEIREGIKPKHLYERIRVIHGPYGLPVGGDLDAEILEKENFFYSAPTGNVNPIRLTVEDRDALKESHPLMERVLFGEYTVLRSFRNFLNSISTGKVIVVNSALVTEEGEIVPNLAVVPCGDTKESCVSVARKTHTSGASARLAAMAFYLAQLYPTAEEIAETIKVCAIDVGEPGIDREFGRGIANLLCPRVLEKEIDIISGYMQEEEGAYTAEGGRLPGTWQASQNPLQVYFPPALKEAIQPTYNGFVEGDISFSEEAVTADFTAAADVGITFLRQISATATDVVQVEGEYATSNNQLTMGGNQYIYTVTEDSLHLVRTLTLNEAFILLPEPFKGLASSTVENLLADDPIRITMSFLRTSPPPPPELIGDFDGNKVVDVADFLLFVAVFGTREGDLEYNRQMDLDKDGNIGISDFLIFVNAFGKTG